MANVTINQLTEKTALALADQLALYDVSNNSTKKTTIENLRDSIGISADVEARIQELEDKRVHIYNGENTRLAQFKEPCIYYFQAPHQIEDSPTTQSFIFKNIYIEKQDEIQPKNKNPKEIRQQLFILEKQSQSAFNIKSKYKKYIRVSGLILETQQQDPRTGKKYFDFNVQNWSPWELQPTRQQIGSTNISTIADGTVTGAISEFNTDITSINANITQINDQMLIADDESATQALTDDTLVVSQQGEITQDIEFTSADTELEPTQSVEVGLFNGNDTPVSKLTKISQMFKNIRYLFKKLGTTDISSIGDGSLTGAIDELNSNVVVLYNNSSASVSDDAITLSDSVDNYRRITIYYKDNDTVFNSVEVFEPYNKDIMLTIPHFNSGRDAMHIKAQIRRISGSQLGTATRSGQFNVYASGNPSIQTTSYIAVTTVVGYKQ